MVAERVPPPASIPPKETAAGGPASLAPVVPMDDAAQGDHHREAPRLPYFEEPRVMSAPLWHAGGAPCGPRAPGGYPRAAPGADAPAAAA